MSRLPVVMLALLCVIIPAALLYRFLPGHPVWAAAILYTAVAVEGVLASALAVRVHRLTR